MVVDAVLASGAAGDEAQGAGTVLVPALSIGGQLVFLKFGRSEEIEADVLGMRYMSRAGWNPEGQREVMEVLAALSADREPEWLATHPHPETRIKEIDRRLASEYRDRQGYQTNAPAYRSRMLDRLLRLPAPKHGGEAAAGAMRLPWCSCAGCHGYADRSD